MKLDHRVWILTLMGVLILPAILSSVAVQPPAAVAHRDHTLASKAPHVTGWTEQAKVTASRGSSGDYFGYSVSVDGEYAVVGAVGENEHSGAAYVFVWDGDSWTQQARLTAGDREPGDNFGYSVSLSGDTAIIGAMGDSDNGANTGSAYIFVRSGDEWIEQAKLTAGDGAQGDHFGWRAAISGDTVIIGAIDDDDNGTSSGSAYVFVRDRETWTEQVKLTPDDGTAGDQFGRGVSLRESYAIVAARALGDDNGDFTGSAYVFVRNEGSWSQQARLTAGDGSTSDRFGHSVAIGEEYAVVGAIGDSNNGTFSGSAYVFVRDGGTWIQQARLAPGDGAAWDRFGQSIAVSGDTAIVGALGSSGIKANTGAAYVFVRDGDAWTEQAKLIAGDGDEQDQFGYSISINGKTAIIGAIGDDDSGDLSGSAYIFQGPAATPTRTPSPTPSSTPAPTTTTPAVPTATPTEPARLNYLPLIAHQ